tara:strand:- start:6653 stop:8191 length:1539 start_codon:yes stop_codon:yes gene_type:complete
MLSSPIQILRILRVAWILARFDALFLLKDAKLLPVIILIVSIWKKPVTKKRPGQRLAAALQELGPSFIKFGQAIATRPDLIGREVATDLSELQDRLPPFSAKKAREIIENELNQPIDELFKEFNDTPVAAASIAQVHFAITSNGDPVAVKVLRPNIELAFEKDLNFFLWLASLAEKTLPASRRLKPVDIVKTLAKSVRTEMDLRLEAAAASEFSRNMSEVEGFQVPRVHWTHTNRRVLTLQRMEGIRIDDIDGLIKKGQDPSKILTYAASAFFQQVFYYGFFHADLHPGNLLVNKNGEVVALDFGIMGRLNKETRLYLAQMLLGFLSRDYERVAEIHFEAGYVSDHESKGLFTQAIRAIGEPVMELPLQEISIARLLGHLFEVTREFNMETQPQLLLLQKSMLMAEGISRQLYPNENMWQLARPLIETWAKKNLGPAAQAQNIAQNVIKEAKRVPRIIEKAETIIEALEKDQKDQAQSSKNTRSIFGVSVFLFFGIIVTIGLLATLIALQLS